MTFKKIKVGQDFIYKDLIYVKLNNNVAFNSTYGTFVIHPHEKVKLLNENIYIETIKNLTPVITIIFVLIIFWIHDKWK